MRSAIKRRLIAIELEALTSEVELIEREWQDHRVAAKPSEAGKSPQGELNKATKDQENEPPSAVHPMSKMNPE
ncbi:MULTISPECIES: hypothetical protein [unclassified Bradyrhizobium]|jgi:hypothetical protein|uniref:hypothetical protein n=1 Tax=unclassified Bradyrhizobium TaxID=2631580 RepID=UPI0033926EBB